MDTKLISYKDLMFIISKAKEYMPNVSLPKYVTGKEIHMTEVPSLAILEITLMFLNSQNILNKFVKVDYTDPCADHDPEPLE